ncbi:MAG: type IV pilus assembly protein PilM [bacterium]
MGLFGGGNKDFSIGVDVSTSGVKLVELVYDKNGATLSTYGYAEFPFVMGDLDPLDNIKGTSGLLKKIVSESDVKSKQVVCGMPMSRVFTSILNAPMVPDKEIGHYVEQQAQKLVSSPISEMKLDWKVLDRAEAEKEKRKSLRVLVSGTRKTLVQKYVDVFGLAGLELISLEPDAFALIRSLVWKDKSTVMIVDMGAARTNISIVERGVPILSRSLIVGGANLTQKLSDILGIQPIEAEQMKRDLKAFGERSTTGLPRSIEEIMQPIVHDIQYLYNQYNEDQISHGGGVVEKIVFTGGSSVVPYFVEYIRNLLGVNAYVGDPFARVRFPADLAPVIDEVGPRFAASIGLALRDE